ASGQGGRAIAGSRGPAWRAIAPKRPRSTDQVIVRVRRARVSAPRVGAFNSVFRRQVALLRDQPGLIYVKLARRLQADGGEEAVLFEEWQGGGSLYSRGGADRLETPLVCRD